MKFRGTRKISLRGNNYMNKLEIIEYCLILPNTYDDYPFEDDSTSVVLKHSKNKKWFALIMEVHNELYLNVKTDPEYSELLRKSYEYIIPAYHMNKQHWNTIIISEKTDENIVKELIEQSYKLTKK
jgi:predicted DNA-binding protein (MmcQ/YjbR family)